MKSWVWCAVLCAFMYNSVQSSPLPDERCKVPQVKNGHMTKIEMGDSSNKFSHLLAEPGSYVSKSTGRIIFFCNQGFQVKNRRSYHLYVTCSEGKLSPNYECIATGCWQPLDEEGIFDITYSNEKRVNSVAHLSCKNEYQEIRGQSERTCQEDGLWSGTNPVCVDHCKIRPVSNGRMEEKRKEVYLPKLGYGMNLHYIPIPSDTMEVFLSCNAGYSVDGTGLESMKLICLQERWSSIPACLPNQKIECPTIDDKGVFNIAYSNGQDVNSIARFSCKNAKQKVEGPHERTCQEDGTWSGTNPECVDQKIECSSIDDKGVFNIAYSNGQDVNSIARFSCKSAKQKVEGPQERTCQEDGTWSGTNPECVDQKIECPTIDDKGVFNIAYSNGQDVNSIARFSCKNADQKIEGPHERTCQEDGTWSGTNPECVEQKIECPIIDDKGVFNIAYSNGQDVNSIARFSCKIADQKIEGPHERTCQEDGTWSGTNPECIIMKIQCEPIYEGNIYTITYSDGQNVGSTAHFSCVDTLANIGNGDVSRTCQKDGQWSGKQPSCIRRGNGTVLIHHMKTTGMQGLQNFLQSSGLQGLLGSSSCHIESRNSSYLSVEPVKDRYSLGDQVSFSCPPGYTLMPNVVAAVCLLSQWSHSFPKCEIR